MGNPGVTCCRCRPDPLYQAKTVAAVDAGGEPQHGPLSGGMPSADGNHASASCPAVATASDRRIQA